ncbi:actin-related protein 2/3 complex subunit 1A isoform X2 [Selaginella moellendorffii]|nr:actin-related protein 2/3 complex subunit 1A isoform X2 [Selaginella moellendorffii]|eukprot:XP_024531662.1 actin-related protein 2/3 complex subunit 1A isoform X2 [Selaginella moellendorffii]
MVAVASHQLAQCISGHAWNVDLTMIAVCTNNEVHIYNASPAPSAVWDRLHVLQKHDQLVSGVDWAPVSNYIVTVSHDRNSYVWKLEENVWQPTLVILRINRAAISVKWSPRENKFAVASGAKSVCVCYYEEDNNWWVSKIIRKKHGSTVTGVAWHPNNVVFFCFQLYEPYAKRSFRLQVLLATTSTDCKCRIFSAYIKGVDSRSAATTTFGEIRFGEQLVQLDLALGWAFGVKWSPSGRSLAYVGHDSTIHFIDDVGPSPIAQTLALRDLPLRDVLFLSEKRLVAGGFDCNPMLFASDDTGTWNFVRFLDEGKTPASDVKASTQFSEAFGKFYGQAKRGVATESPSSAPGTYHNNCITLLNPLAPPGEQEIRKFSTSGMDGKVVIWDMSTISDALARLGM